jgi:hypothetical protein
MRRPALPLLPLFLSKKFTILSADFLLFLLETALTPGYLL